MKSEEGSLAVQSFSGMAIQEICGCVKRVSPINRRETSLE
jgi:hypothetical protein